MEKQRYFYLYKTKNLISMYDGHKPKFEIKCPYCGIIFVREKKRTFCSISCARKYQNANFPEINKKRSETHKNKHI